MRATDPFKANSVTSYTAALGGGQRPVIADKSALEGHDERKKVGPKALA
jgi:hypothetical protein